MSGEVEIIEVPQPTQPKVIARSSCDQRVRLATCVDSSKTMPWLLRKGMSTKGISGFSCRWITVLYSSTRRLRSTVRSNTPIFLILEKLKAGF